ncbi:MAG: methylmalonyl Co-A mutase-associated GTPase MeaB [Candidatus Krumholzibacteria bacterium]|nr:methylmalonyl Co-A mutase-associated GTPase MeaB [Candidatus Krumholzibacteria bacterium]
MHAEYFNGFYRGEILAVSRLMSVVERGGEEAEAILNEIFPKVGRAYRVGVTGLTGAGKSTLVNELTRRCRLRGQTVGVVAEDPTSPFSGGAILGDRVRMQDSTGDEGVFIRSIASRGSETGLSACANELADVLDAFGRDIIFLETIGIGQLEYRIRYSGHTTAVVLTPDAGDDVQSLKSGLMEIGDIFVVNKADRAHAQRYADDLRSMLELTGSSREWLPPVVNTVAVKGEGVDELMEAIERHRAYLSDGGRFEQKRIESLQNRITTVVDEKTKELFWKRDHTKRMLEDLLEEVVSGQKSPYQAANEIIAAQPR